MSEKIELIDAKDLPMTEEEDVTVLCVGADGEMVRKDAGSFGMKASDLAELPTTEAEEVDVICVDAEGNLCRKSSASFGSGSEESYDLDVIGDIAGSWTIVNGTFADIKEKIKSKIPVKCRVRSFDEYNQVHLHPVHLLYDEEDEEIEIKTVGNDGVYTYYLGSDNTFGKGPTTFFAFKS